MAIKKLLGKGLRAVGSRMQKKQQDKLMNPTISKMGSTRTMGTKSSFPRTTLLERRGKSRREMMDDALAAKKTGKGEGPEKKKAIRERQGIEKSKKKLNAMREELAKLRKISTPTAAQRRRIKTLEKAIADFKGAAMGEAKREVKRVAGGAGKGRATAARARANRAQRSRDEKELAGMAKSEKLAAARKKKEAQIKKLEGLMKPKGPKVRRTKKFMEERKEMKRKAAAKMKGKK